VPIVRPVGVRHEGCHDVEVLIEVSEGGPSAPRIDEIVDAVLVAPARCMAPRLAAEPARGA